MECRKASQDSHQNSDNKTYNRQNRRNHAADFSGLRRASASRIHCARIHFFEVTVAHHPRDNAAWKANDQSKNAENEN